MSVESHNLLTIDWNMERLQWFFGQLPVKKWFNRSAPPIKNGLIDPATLTANQALTLMISNPLLIRRPLMEVDGFPVVGFDLATLDRTIGLAKAGHPILKPLGTKPTKATEWLPLLEDR